MDFPDGLDTKIKHGSYGITSAENKIAGKTDGGDVHRRVRYVDSDGNPRKLIRWEFTLRLNNTEKGQMWTFYFETTAHGTLPFTWTDIDDTEYTVQFGQEPKWVPINAMPTAWDVAVTLMEV